MVKFPRAHQCTRPLAPIISLLSLHLPARRAFAKKLNDAPLAIVDKRRSAHNVSEVMNLIGDVKGKVAVLVDDMIDTAGTITNAAKVPAALVCNLMHATPCAHQLCALSSAKPKWVGVMLQGTCSW